MPSTYTSNLGVEKPGTGEQDGVWGDTVNENMDILDRAINGVLSLSITGTSSTLTTSDGALSNGQYKLLVIGGTPSGTHTITLAPNDAQKIYYVYNTTAQSVVFTQGSGGNVTLAAGDSAIIYSNGGGAAAAVVNLTDHFAMSSPKITGGSIDGTAIGGTTAAAGTFTTGTFGLGAVGTPSITITGDPNTGLWSPGADTLAISTGGAERLRIDSAGDVGIGTNNPLRPLHIVTSGATNAAAYLQNDTGDATIFLRSQDTGAVSIQFGDTTAFNSGLLQYTNSTDLMMLRSTGAMTFQSGGATERARIHASGGVSIGNVTDPGATNLSVTGAISTGDAATTRTNLGLTIGTNVQAYDAGLNSIAGLTTAANQMIYTTAADTYATTGLTAAGRAILDDADATAQRATLGLTIGTNVQAYDAGLQSISGLTTAADTMIYTTALDTYATTGLTAAGRAILDDIDAAAQRATLGLTIGTNVQAYDAGLQSISGLTTAADTMIYTTALDTYTTTPLTAAGRALLDDADAASQRSTLGLGTMSTQGAGAVAITGGAISGATINGTTIGATTPSTGTFTTGTFGLGAVGTPSITITGDPNTGFWSPGADILAISTGGAERARIDASGNLGVGGTANAAAILDVISTTKGFRAPSMTTTQRDAIASPVAGLLIYNTTLNFYQVYNGTAWTSVGGGATGGGTDQVFFENGQTVTTNYTITDGKNAMSAGPITINAGITVTVGAGEVWTIV